MLTIDTGMPNRVFACTLSGSIARDDYDDFLNRINASINDGYDISVLVENESSVDYGDDMQGEIFENLVDINGRARRFAWVGDERFRPIFLRIEGFLRDCETRMFASGQKNDAVVWILASPWLEES